MPELPEVEIMARNLDRWVGGAVVHRVEVVDPRVVAAGDLRRAEGCRVQRVWRRAKYAVVDLEPTGHMVFHFRMTGKIVRRAGRGRVRMRMSAGAEQLVFEDARCLGQIWWLSSPMLESFFQEQGLGPEPWPEVRSGTWWSTQLRGLRGPVKPALMRQDRVAGIGNILASEACWRACVHPAALVPSLSPEQWQAVSEGVRSAIDHTLAEESGEEIVYMNQGGEGSFSVYGRAGQPCSRCDRMIERMEQSGRASFFCPGCQSPSRCR